MIPDQKQEAESAAPAAVSRARGGWRVVIGLLIIGWGLLLTAANLGSNLAYTFLARWYFPAALMVIGLFRLWSAETGMGRTIGVGLAVLGGWWLIAQTFALPFDLSDWWPLVLIAIGVGLVVRAWRPEGGGGAPGGRIAGEPATWHGGTPFAPSEPVPASGDTAGAGAAPPVALVDSGPVSAFAVWAGVQRRVAAAFKRADLVAIMGGIELDLRSAVPVGGRAVVEVFVLMGGVEITIPPDWAVSNDAVAIMGAVEDTGSGSQGAKYTLELRGFVMMGGVEIKV